MKLRFSRRAIRDVADIATFIRERNPEAVGKVRASILDALKTISAFPRVGRPQSVPRVRKLVTRRYPYLIYYSIDDEASEVVILAIRHPAQPREYTDL